MEPDLHVQQLPYQRDSSHLMTQLAPLEGAAFLDSGLTDQVNARFDILTALPRHTLEVPHSGAGEPAFGQLRRMLEDGAPSDGILNDPRLTGLPFRGGAIGYVAYPARGDLIEFRSRPSRPGHPQPCQPVIDVGIYHWGIVVDHENQRSSLFFLPACPPATRQRVLDILRAPPPAPAPFRLLSDFQPGMSRDDYEKAFGRLMDWILAGDCYQANLAQRFHAACRGDPLQAYLRLRQASHSPFSAYLRQKRGAVLSLSPERFLQVEERRVRAEPIKGTRPRGRNGEEDRRLREELLNSAKDRAENLMIVDLLRNDLGSLCETGSVRTESLFTLRSYTSVHHLVSTITGRLASHDHALNLLQACFPGGSITGAPKIRAMQIIDQLEPDGRSVYCGSVIRVGFEGNMDSNIAIRTLLCDDGHVYCWGGGGIVADSRCDQEYQESLNKISLLINTLESSFRVTDEP